MRQVQAASAAVAQMGAKLAAAERWGREQEAAAAAERARRQALHRDLAAALQRARELEVRGACLLCKLTLTSLQGTIVGVVAHEHRRALERARSSVQGCRHCMWCSSHVAKVPWQAGARMPRRSSEPPGTTLQRACGAELCSQTPFRFQGCAAGRE